MSARCLKAETIEHARSMYALACAAMPMPRMDMHAVVAAIVVMTVPRLEGFRYGRQ